MKIVREEAVEQESSLHVSATDELIEVEISFEGVAFCAALSVNEAEGLSSSLIAAIMHVKSKRG